MLQATSISPEASDESDRSTLLVPERCAFVSLKESRILGVLNGTPLTVEEISGLSLTNPATTRILAKSLVEKGLVAIVGDGRFLLPNTRAEKGFKVTPRHGDVHCRIGRSKTSFLVGDAEDRLRGLAESGVIFDVGVTSSPYWKERDYWTRGQMGWEPTPDAFASRMLDILAQVARVLSPCGFFFWNFDDHVDKGKLFGIDRKVLTRIEEIGLEEHREIVWVKTNATPSGTDRSMAHAHEKIYMLRHKRADHYWDFYNARQDAKTGGMKRLSDVWEFPVANNGPFKGVHNALFPIELVKRCLDVAASEGGYCPKCRAPWERDVERGESTWKKVGATHQRSSEDAMRRGKADFNEAIYANGKVAKKKMADMKHIGWRRAESCSHVNAAPVAARIFDPFMGAGTTALECVARGYNFTGIDINHETVAIAANAVVEHGRKP